MGKNFMRSFCSVALAGGLLILPVVLAGADTLYLNNGKKINGKIIERTEKSTKVDISGVTITYYADEIDHIEEGKPAAAAPETLEKKSGSPLDPEKAPMPPAAEASAPDETGEGQKLIPPTGAQDKVPETAAQNPPLPSTGEIPAPASSAVSMPDLLPEAAPAKEGTVPAVSTSTSENPAPELPPKAVPPKEETLPAPAVAAPPADLAPSAAAGPDKTATTPFTEPLPQGSKRELIVKLIDAMGTRSSLDAMFDQLMKEAKPGESEQLKKAFKTEEVVERLIPVYDKYFSEEEIQVLLSFYQSPVGRKLIRVTPSLMEDSMQANEKYFQEVLPKPLTP